MSTSELQTYQRPDRLQVNDIIMPKYLDIFVKKPALDVDKAHTNNNDVSHTCLLHPYLKDNFLRLWSSIAALTHSNIMLTKTVTPSDMTQWGATKVTNHHADKAFISRSRKLKDGYIIPYNGTDENLATQR